MKVSGLPLWMRNWLVEQNDVHLFHGLYFHGSRSFRKNFLLYGSNVLKATLTCVALMKAALTCVALMTRALSQGVIAHPVLKAVVGTGWLLAGFSPPPRETDAAATSLITIPLTRTVVRTQVVHPARGQRSQAVA